MSSNGAEHVCLDVSILLLRVLGHGEGEYTSLGFGDSDGVFYTEVLEPQAAVTRAERTPPTTNGFLGVNTVAGPARQRAGRGEEVDITRLAALAGDLDFEKCLGRPEVAEAIIAALSDVLGTRPSAITHSGHGLHPYWPISDGNITGDDSRRRAKALLTRWKRLIAVIAEDLGATADNVFDLTRMLRIPGTYNNKEANGNGAQPIPVVTYEDDGHPLTVEEIDHLLTEAGVAEQDGDGDIGGAGEVISKPSEWEWAKETCPYVASVIGAWATDGPKDDGGRNPWAASQFVRLMCAYRLGCVTEADYDRAVKILTERLRELLQTTAPRRKMRRYEIRDLKKLGNQRASQKTDDQCRDELGGHTHIDDIFTLDGPAGGDGVSKKVWFTDGATFILDIPDVIPAIWGEGEDVLWADGESLMIAGPMGLGKTTLLGLLIRAQLGVGDPVLLGLPVAVCSGKILYLAMDRPAQIARALRRQFTEADREILAGRVVIWKGPPPKDIAKNPTLLPVMAEAADAQIVYLDSVKDAAIGLSDDEVGAGYNKARQLLLREGRQLAEAHHTTKRGANGGPPTTVADIYGSTWITNGTGSIILVSGDPGDPIVGFRHVRQPVKEVGPYQLLHDQDSGALSIHHSVDLVELARLRAPEGLDARTAAGAVFGTTNPTPAQIEKTRRRLVKLTKDGLLTSNEGARGRAEGSAAVWFAGLEVM
jgi:hypothetical protein